MRILAVLSVVVLSGCASSTPPPAPIKISEMSVCDRMFAVISSDWSNYAQKETAREIGRNNGCFGPAQQQRLEVTVR